MKIAINALSAKKGGGLTYLLELTKNLPQIKQKHNYFIFTSSYNYKKFKKLSSDSVSIINTRVSSIFYRLMYEQIIIPMYILILGIDLIFCPAEILSFFSPCIKILGVQNPNIYYNQYIKKSPSKILRKRLLKIIAQFSLNKSDLVIAVSNALRHKVSNRMGTPLKKIKFIHHGINNVNSSQKNKNEQEYIKKKYNIKDKYILNVAHLWPHKNIETLITAYQNLPNNLIDKYQLVIVGDKKTKYYKYICRKYINKEYLNKRIIFTGQVKYKNVEIFYSNASLFVFPSYLETFGIPLLEAASNGIPILGANTTSIPEVLGKAGMLFDPNCPKELTNKIRKILTDQQLYKKLKKTSEKRARHFSWHATACNTLKTFEKIYKLKNK